MNVYGEPKPQNERQLTLKELVKLRNGDIISLHGPVLPVEIVNHLNKLQDAVDFSIHYVSRKLDDLKIAYIQPYFFDSNRELPGTSDNLLGSITTGLPMPQVLPRAQTHLRRFYAQTLPEGVDSRMWSYIVSLLNPEGKFPVKPVSLELEHLYEFLKIPYIHQAFSNSTQPVLSATRFMNTAVGLIFDKKFPNSARPVQITDPKLANRAIVVQLL